MTAKINLFSSENTIEEYYFTDNYKSWDTHFKEFLQTKIQFEDKKTRSKCLFTSVLSAEFSEKNIQDGGLKWSPKNELDLQENDPFFKSFFEDTEKELLVKRIFFSRLRFLDSPEERTWRWVLTQKNKLEMLFFFENETIDGTPIQKTNPFAGSFDGDKISKKSKDFFQSYL